MTAYIIVKTYPYDGSQSNEAVFSDPVAAEECAKKLRASIATMAEDWQRGITVEVQQFEMDQEPMG